MLTNPSKHRPQCCTCLMKLMRAVLWLALLVNLHIRGATVQGDLGVALELAKIQTRTSPLPSPPLLRPAPWGVDCDLHGRPVAVVAVVELLHHLSCERVGGGIGWVHG